MNLAAFDDMLKALRAVDELYVFFDTMLPPHLGYGARAALALVREAIAKAESNGGVVVSLEENALTYQRARIALTPTVCEVAAVLADNFGETVAKDRVILRVWGHLDAGCGRTLDQHIMRLRRALRPIGLNVHSTYGRGYRLDVA